MANLILPRGVERRTVFDPKRKVIEMKRSDFVKKAMKLQGKPVDFTEWPSSELLLDLEYTEMIFMGGRQITKSSTLAWDNILDMTEPYISDMYLAPSIQQAKTFSNDRVKARLDESPLYKEMFVGSGKNLYQNVFEKEFKSNSKTYYCAASQLENLRGKSAARIKFDEAQDLSLDVIQIVSEVATAQKNVKKLYACTSKTLSNYTAKLWKSSLQISPVIFCDSNHANLPTQETIKPDGLHCIKCNARLSVDPQHVKWTALGDPNSRIIGVWIPQTALPFHINDPQKYYELYQKFVSFPPERFSNEVLGLPTGYGSKQLSEQDLIKACGEWDMWEFHKETAGMGQLYAGIDWGIKNDESGSYTVLTIGGLNVSTGTFDIVYIKVFRDPDPNNVLDEICQICYRFGIEVYICDFGAGHKNNADLALKTGGQVFQCMYVGGKKEVAWEESTSTFKVHRATAIEKFCYWIRAKRIRFFKWEQFKQFAPMYLALYFETSYDRYGNVTITYDHDKGDPDDAFQSGCILVVVGKNWFDPVGVVLK